MVRKENAYHLQNFINRSHAAPFLPAGRNLSGSYLISSFSVVSFTFFLNSNMLSFSATTCYSSLPILKIIRCTTESMNSKYSFLMRWHFFKSSPSKNIYLFVLRSIPYMIKDAIIIYIVPSKILSACPSIKAAPSFMVITSSPPFVFTFTLSPVFPSLYATAAHATDPVPQLKVSPSTPRS